ncbi:NUDIX hydrolase [Candidatus Woesearchaeota archaeon]|nr:NUDIX hydrolase [Candidatus Woesearchaeota archaeon]
MKEKIRKCSGVIIYKYNERDDDFEILLIKTRNFKDAGQYLYTIVGGRIEEIDKGETIEQKAQSCAERETWEEVRLGISEMAYIGMNTAVGRDIGYKDPEMQFEFHHFAAKAVGTLNTLDILLANDEVIYAGFHKRQELSSLAMEPELRRMLKTYTITQENTFESETSSQKGGNFLARSLKNPKYI